VEDRRRYQTKRILRDAMRGRVPAEILDRRDKLGFEAPDVAWLGGPLRGWFTQRARGCGGRISSGLLDRLAHPRRHRRARSR